MLLPICCCCRRPAAPPPLAAVCCICFQLSSSCLFAVFGQAHRQVVRSGCPGQGRQAVLSEVGPPRPGQARSGHRRAARPGSGCRRASRQVARRGQDQLALPGWSGARLCLPPWVRSGCAGSSGQEARSEGTGAWVRRPDQPALGQAQALPDRGRRRQSGQTSLSSLSGFALPSGPRVSRTRLSHASLPFLHRPSTV